MIQTYNVEVEDVKEEDEKIHESFDDIEAFFNKSKEDKENLNISNCHLALSKIKE